MSSKVIYFKLQERSIKSVAENNINFMELKILGKIPLEQLERTKRKKSPEVFFPEIKNELRGLVERVNARFGNILNSDGRVRVRSKEDYNFVTVKEDAWARESGMTLEDYRLKKEKSKGNLAEMAITLLLDKISEGRLLSVRSSKWDDYENGIDNLLLDTKTGAVICGLDEVFDDFGQSANEEKEDKVMTKFNKGGAYARYGLRLDKKRDRVNIERVNNLPTFFISLNRESLVDILENLKNEELKQSEKNVLIQIISSLKSQLNKMTENEEKIPTNLKSNLDKIPEIINFLEEKI